MRSPIILAALLFAVVFAGCVDGDAGAETDPEIPAGSIAIEDPTTGARSFVRAYSTANPDAAAEEIWIRDNWTGSFGATDFWTNGQEVPGAAGLAVTSHQTFDISDLIPRGVPAWVMMEVDLGFTEGDVDIWISAPDDDTWAAEFDTPRGGYSNVENVLVYSGDGPVTLNLFYDEREGTEGFDFSVAYEIYSSPWILMPGVPTTVEVPTGARSLEIRYVGDTQGDVSVWRFDDDYLGRFAPEGSVVNLTLDEGVRGGDYVVLSPADVGPALVNVYAPTSLELPDRPLRLGTVTQNIVRTDPVEFGVNEGGSVEFDVPFVPLQAGMRVGFERLVSEVNIELAGPSGSIIRERFSDTTPFLNTHPDGGVGFGFWTPLGATELESGTYTATFVGGANSAGNIRGMYVGYTR